ncbi:MAG: hypothetical protein ACQGVC_21130 [Myxococcota bacterium]
MRIRPLPMSQASRFTRFAAWLMRRQNGGVDSPAPAVYGHNPPVLASFLLFGAGYLRWRSLPARLKRLVHLRTAMRVGCPS